MKMRLAMMIGILATSAWAKDRAWQDGSLLDSVSNKYFPSVERTTDEDKTPTSRTFNGSQLTQAKTVQDHYVVESEEAVYLVERQRFKSAKPADLRPYRPVKFAIEKQKIWMLDEEGKQQEATILKRIEKDVPRQSVTAGLPAH